MVDVDVVVPCYKYANYLDNCITSILAQRDVSVRVLILDDASPDDTAAVAARLTAADPRLEYLCNTQNLGLIGTANRGVIEWAKAPYTVFISADDALTPGSLARALQVFRRHANVGLIYGMSLVIGQDDERYRIFDPDAFEYGIVSGPDFIKEFCEHKSSVAAPAVVVRTDLQHKIGPYNPGLPYTSDIEMWLRFACHSDIGVINVPQAYYRWHNTNMSHANLNTALLDLHGLLATSTELRAGDGKGIAHFDEWIAKQKQTLSNEAFWRAGLAIEQGDKNGEKACLDFAVKNHPAKWTSSEWRTYHIKRLLGADVIRALRKTTGRSAYVHVPFKEGGLFGWWPGAKGQVHQMSRSTGPEAKTEAIS